MIKASAKIFLFSVRLGSLLFQDLPDLLPPTNGSKVIVSSIISATVKCPVSCPVSRLMENVSIQLHVEVRTC